VQISKSLIFSLLFSFLSVNNTYAADEPSYDCNLASTDVEKIICESPKSIAMDIRSLDVIIAKVYSAARSINSDVKASQLEWLASRNHCITENEQKSLLCLLEGYNNRASQLLSIGGQPNLISIDNVCEIATFQDCTDIVVQLINDGNENIFVFGNQYKSYLISVNEKGINWDRSWSGHAIRSADYTKKVVRLEETDTFPEHLIVKGRYRNGCPDCGTQDSVFINLDGKWEPLNLSRLNRVLGLFTNVPDEIYMYIDSHSGIVRVKYAFDNYRQAQVEDYSYLMSKGRVSGNIFIPETYEVTIR